MIDEHDDPSNDLDVSKSARRINVTLSKGSELEIEYSDLLLDQIAKKYLISKSDVTPEIIRAFVETELRDALRSL